MCTGWSNFSAKRYQTKPIHASHLEHDICSIFAGDILLEMSIVISPNLLSFLRVLGMASLGPLLSFNIFRFILKHKLAGS